MQKRKALCRSYTGYWRASFCRCKREISWKESSEENEREHLTFEYECACRQQSDRDEKLSECASEISLRKSRLGSRAWMRFGCFFQAQYKVDGPCCHWLAPKVNGIFWDRGSNFRIRQWISPFCNLLILIFDPREFMSWTHSGLSSNAMIKIPPARRPCSAL